MSFRTLVPALIAAAALSGCDPPPQASPGVSTYDGVYRGTGVAHTSNAIFCFPTGVRTMIVSSGIAKMSNYGSNETRIGTVTPDGQLTMQGTYSGVHAVTSGHFSGDKFVALSGYGTGVCEYDWVLQKIGNGGPT